jgi:hypothetical protein
MGVNITQKLIQTVLKKRMIHSTGTGLGLVLRKMSTSVHMYLKTVSFPCAPFPALMSCALIVEVGKQ